MNILSTMDYLHHLRTWVIPQAMRRYGILTEGWNPKADRYEHKFLGFVYRFVHFYTAPTTHPYANLPKVDPLPFPKGPYLKEKYCRQGTGFEVTLPKGYVRVYHSLDDLKKELSAIRTATASYHRILTEVAKSSSKINQTTANRLIRKRTGLPLSQLGCDPASLIVIKSLKTGASVVRTPLSFKVSEGCKAAMQEEFSYPMPSSMAMKTKLPALPAPVVLH